MVVSCIRCKGKMYQDTSSGRVENGSCATVRITGYRCSQCGNWLEVYLPPAAVDADHTKVKEPPRVVIAPVLSDPPEWQIAADYFDNIASMLRSRTGWQTIARLIGHAKGHAVDGDALMDGYEHEKQRRHDIRLQERNAGRKVKHG